MMLMMMMMMMMISVFISRMKIVLYSDNAEAM
jgi:hypothetical protein